MSIDLSPWGYAPGGYTFKCCDCTDYENERRWLDHYGTAAKRSWRCKAHAEVAREAAIEKDKIEHLAALQRVEARDHGERVTELLAACSREVNYRRLLKRLLKRADAILEAQRTYLATRGASGSWEKLITASVAYDTLRAVMPENALDPKIPALLEEFK